MAHLLVAHVREAYLRRLGLQAEPPSVAALHELHRRHVERVPYETLWIHGGEAWGIDPQEAAARIALDGRGGYCYHLNGAFALLLASLGYDVRRHIGGVHGPDGPSPESLGNHLVLSVGGLPTDEHVEGTWYVDVGLGDALHQPIPLAAGSSKQGPFRLELAELDSGWHLRHDPAGGFAGMLWRVAAVDGWEAFIPQHEHLSTSPDSGFVKIGMAESRDATGVDVIRGLQMMRIGSDARSEELSGRDPWFEALHDLFELRFDASPPGTADRLWERTLENHRAWDAAGRP
ncbi:MAG TPA: arylamine N-acetyltransferase [Kineosporiaceae bacterium]|nr:arylamine N-acetyltransferase [Kineosporiaceae bacterium]